MSTADNKYIFEDYNAQSGPFIHFQNVQAEDLFLFAILLDVKKCAINKGVHKIFKQQYRHISLFAMEELYNEINNLKLGDTGYTDLRISGDILYQLALVSTYPEVEVDVLHDEKDALSTTYKRWCYVSNLGPSQIKQSIMNIDGVPMDQNNTVNLVILQQLLRRTEQLVYWDKMVGNTNEIAGLSVKKGQIKTMTVLKMFFSDSPQKAFPYLRAGQPTIKVYLNLRRPKDLVCHTRNLENEKWDELCKLKQMGFISTEIFLNEHERILHVNSDAHYLIEQNMIFYQTGLQNQFEPNIIHPVKFLYWGILKEKFQKGNYFLSFKQFIQPNQDDSDFLYDSSLRFIYRFAAYIASVDYKAITPPLANDLNASTALTSANIDYATSTQIPGYSYKRTGPEGAILTFKTDQYDIIQSCFTGQVLSNETNDSEFSIQKIFARLQAQPLIIEDKQRFGKKIGVLLANDLLTIDEASVSIDQWEMHMPKQHAFVGQDSFQDGAKSFGNTLFSMYSEGEVEIKYGSTNQYVVSTNRTYKASDLFSPMIRDEKFNYGLSDFDICVKQWDNFGKYLNKTGDSIQTTQLFIGSTPRFKKSGYYTSIYHQFQHFHGRTPDGVHIYSFCLEPEQIQATGSLNFTKAQPKITIIDDGSVNDQDQLFVSAIVYNVIDFRESTFQLLYNTTMNSI